MTGLTDIFCERHSRNLRHTQTEVNHPFARDALVALCVERNNVGMKIRLEQIRLARNLNLEDLAGELGVAISTVQRWEKQSMSIPSEKLPAIARAYGCDVVDIFKEPASEQDPDLPPEVYAIWQEIPKDRTGLAINILKQFADGPDDTAAAS